MQQLFHISFRELPPTLKPRQPEDSGLVKGNLVEDLPPRVSFAPTIQQCFLSIYPNVSQLFETEDYPHMDMLVYVPSRALKPIDEKLVRSRVWDSHVTGEVCFDKDVPIVKVAKIRIPNPLPYTRKNEVYARPHNNPFVKAVFIGPKIDFEVLEQYHPMNIA